MDVLSASSCRNRASSWFTKDTISMRRCSILALSPGTGDLAAESAAELAASGVDVLVGFQLVETKEESFC